MGVLEMISKCNNRRHLFRIAGGTAILALLLLTGGAGAATNISDCQDITSPGEYVGNMNITNSSASSCINITSSDVIFDGAGFVIGGLDISGTVGVYVYNSSAGLTNVTVKNVVVTDWELGIYYYNATNGIIANINASSNTFGIYLTDSSYNNLTNNTASSNNDVGIYLHSSSDNALTDNTADSNTGSGIIEAGIYLTSSSNNNLTNNTANSNNNYGIRLENSNSNTVSGGSVNSNGNDGVYVLNSNDVNVTRVEIHNNTNTGIYDQAGGFSYQNFSYNNISGSSNGIYLIGEDNSNIEGNRIWNNSYGIYLESSSTNTIYNNYFSNTNNASDDGANFWNTTQASGTNIVGGTVLGGNFWASPDGNGFSQTCEDANSDGICDTTFGIDGGGGGIDYLPLAPAPSMTITITSPDNNSVNDTGYVNVTVTLSKQGTARLNWQGVNESMLPAGTGTSFYNNKTDLLSGNYTFKVYANDSSGMSNASETRIVTVNRTTSINLSSYIDPATGNVNQTVNLSAPSGNATLTIFNGTNVTLGGAPITNITIDSISQVNSTFVASLGSSERLIGENLSMGPEGARFSPDIQIRFNYTDAALAAAGIAESDLVVKFYNTSATPNAWETLTKYYQDTTLNYTIVNVSHFSTFALLGTITTGGGGTSTSGAGTGGGGVTSSEPFDNIAKAERYDRDLIANTPVTYRFADPEHSIYEVVVTGTANEGNVALRCEALKDTSKLVTASAPGTVYKNENIWLGTKRIKEATIRFKVENSWLGSNNLAGSDIKMVKWDGSKWVQIETAEKNKDDKHTYYEAKTDTFSHFVITGLKGVEVPTATPAVAVIEPIAAATTLAPAPTEKAPGFELALSAAALCAVYLFWRRRR